VRPTVEEQLEGSCRILEETIAPEVTGDQAAEALRGVVKNLRMLGKSWAQVLPFLHWDNGATAALLERARPNVPAPLAQRLGDLDGNSDDPFDVAAARHRNTALRGLLSEVVAVLDPASVPAAATHRAIVEHLSARAARYPMRMVPDVPRAAVRAEA
jgi:hypothetical protein